MAVDNKRIAKNTMALYARMLLLMAVSLYTSRVILLSLGINDYGIYNLIGGFISLFSFITTALVGAMQRYFNVALGHDDHEEYRRIYSMGINIFTLFSILLIIIGESIGLWFITTQLNIPLGRETAALWVYQVSLATMIVQLFRTPDNASIIAHERMSFYAYISIFEAVIKLAIAFTLNWLNTDKLVLYVWLYFAASLLINVLYFLYCNRRITDCRFMILWDSALFKKMVSFSGWYILTGGSRVFKTQGENYLLNHYYSVAVNAAFGVAAQVYNAVNLFLTNFQTAFNPQLVQSHASGDLHSHRKLVARSARLSFFLLLVIVLPISFNLDSLLELWLKEVPLFTKEFCIFLLLAYLVDSIGAPLGVSVNADGRIQGMQIFSAIIILSGLLSSFIFLRAGALPYVVAIVTFFVHVGFWLCYMYYARKYCGISLRLYFWEVIFPCLFVVVSALTVPIGISFLPSSPWTLIPYCLVDFIWAAVIIYMLGMNGEEKYFLKMSIRSYIQKQRSIKSKSIIK